MDVPLDEVVKFDGIASSSTGAAADADSTPTFAVYEEDTDTDIGVGGNMTKRTSLTGNYRGSFTASAANGFELGKWYTVIGSATIGSVATKGVLKHFRVVAAEAVSGYPRADISHFGGTAGTFASGRPEVNTSHFGGTAGTFAGGRPDVNTSHFGGTAGTFASGRPEVNTTHAAGTAWGSGAITAASIASAAFDDKGNWLKPTTAGRTLDVSAGGEAGIDWANVGSPTTTVNLSGTTISTTQAVASVAGAVGSVTGNVGGSVASIATGGISSASFGSGAITAASIAAAALNGKGDWLDEGYAATIDLINSDVDMVKTDVTSALALLADIPTVAEFEARTLVAASYSTAANLLIATDRLGFTLSILAGNISDAGTAAETFAITLNGNTFTADYTGQDASGNRGTTTLTKT